MDKGKGIASFDKSGSKFKTLVKSGPVFVCVVCNRCHYHECVIFWKCIDTMLIEIPFSWWCHIMVIIIFVRRVIKHCETIECHVRQLQISYL